MQITRKQVIIIFLSIVLPVSLFAALRLAGVFSEPATPEILAAEIVDWSMSRPYRYEAISGLVNNSYTDNGASVDVVVHVRYYYENDPVLFGLDNVYSDMLVNVSVNEGFVESLFVNFTKLDEHAALDVSEDMDTMQMVNVEVSKISDWNLVFGRDAYIRATSVNHPKNASLRLIFAWIFNDPDNADHLLAVTLEATVFNGGKYQRIQVPIQMQVSQS